MKDKRDPEALNPSYEKPKIISLSRPARAKGDCVEGSAHARCTPGSANSWCTMGTNAGYNCGGGINGGADSDEGGEAADNTPLYSCRPGQSPLR